MKTIVMMFVVMFSACAPSPDGTDTVQSGLCTIEDQSAGFCSGPFTALAAATRDEASANGASDVDAVTVDCISGVAGQKFCSLAIDLPFCRLVVNCTKYADGNTECYAGCY